MDFLLGAVKPGVLLLVFTPLYTRTLSPVSQRNNSYRDTGFPAVARALWCLGRHLISASEWRFREKNSSSNAGDLKKSISCQWSPWTSSGLERLLSSRQPPWTTPGDFCIAAILAKNKVRMTSPNYRSSRNFNHLCFWDRPRAEAVKASKPDFSPYSWGRIYAECSAIQAFGPLTWHPGASQLMGGKGL